jgi:FAD/FMN-containing dehydrogenase
MARTGLEHSLSSMTEGAALGRAPAEAAADVPPSERTSLASNTGQSTPPGAIFPLDGATRPLVPTYDRLRDFRPRSLVRCASVDEVKAAVVEASSNGLKVRAKGNGFSWAPHVATQGVSIALDGLNRIGEFDAKAGSITVDAGVRLGDLTRALACHGMAVPSLSFLSEVSVGGAVATATHGTSPRWGTLSDFVESITLVLPSGDVRVIGAEAEQELRAARASVGMLGVIVSITLRVRPIPLVRFSQHTMSLDAFLGTRHEMLRRYSHVWVNWTLGTDQVNVDCLEECSDPHANGHSYIIGDNAVWRPENKAPTLAHRVGRKLRTVGRHFAQKVSDRSMANAFSFKTAWVSMQYGLPLSEIESVISEIATSRFSRRHAGRLLEFKFLAGSTKTMLGPNTKGDSVLFNMLWQVVRSGADHAFDDFEDLMIARKARPHWGKQHRSPTIAYMREAYSDWDDFARVMDRFDPDRVFSIFDEEHPALAS